MNITSCMLRRWLFLCGAMLASVGNAAPSDYGPATSHEDYLKLPDGAKYVNQRGGLAQKNPSGVNDSLLSHKPGCARDPSLKATNAYRPMSSPDCREDIPGPFFVYPDAPPFIYPSPAVQTHGLDLTRTDEATSKAYFKWLCENEAGDWIYKKAENVEALFVMRNRDTYDWQQNNWEMFDRFYSEDPWGQVYETSNNPIAFALRTSPPWTAEFLFPDGPDVASFATFLVQEGFELYERPLTRAEQIAHPGFRFARYTGPWPANARYLSDIKDVHTPIGQARPSRKPGEVWMLVPYVDRQYIRNLRFEPTNEIKSRYGFFWRGISRTPYDRLLGIAGTEEYVIDMRTNEILSLKRSFVRALFNSQPPMSKVSWDRRETCPHSTRWSHREVLIPRDPFKAGLVNLKTAPGPE